MSQISIFDGAERLKITKPIRLIELFAGIGAQAKALERLGVEFEHHKVCEIDKFAVKSYNAIHGTHFTVSDITKLNGADLGIVDVDRYEYILTYSYPCTSLSLAGKQEGMAEGSGTKSSLLWEVKRLLMECSELPQILLMENVPQVLNEKNRDELYRWIEFLSSKGYQSKWCTMNAKDYGVPQNRERCFMISWRGEYYYDFPKPKRLELRMKDLIEPEVDEKYYLKIDTIEYFRKHSAEQEAKGNVEMLCGGNREVKIVALDEQNGYIRQDGTVGTIMTDGSSSKHNNRVVLYNGYNQRVRADQSCVGTLTRNCGADLKRNGQGVIENTRVRRLTPRECFRLMDFDDADFDRVRPIMSDAQLYKQAGNSIVVNCLVEIFKEML